MEAITEIYGQKEGLSTKEGKITAWPYSEPEPTQEELDLIVFAYNYNTQYIKDRQRAYPTVQDQLDKIYHDGIAAWKVDIKAIKDAYPKPIA